MRLPGKGIGWKHFFKRLYEEWNHDNVGNVAGSLTFFGVLALVPFLVFIVSLASLVVSGDQVQAMIQAVARAAPPDVTKIFAQEIQTIQGGKPVGLLTVSMVGSLWSAAGGMSSLQQALNTCYDVKEGRPFWKSRGIALLMTIFTSVMTLLAGLVAIGGPAVAHFVGGPLATVINWLRFPVAGVLVMFVWAVLYWALPDVETKFKFITPGSVVGVVVWVIASVGFSIYVNNFGHYDATYGALGAVIVFLMWMWISAQVLLLGAEINAVIEHLSPEGKRPGAKNADDTNAAANEKRRRGVNVPGDAPMPQPIRLPVRGFRLRESMIAAISAALGLTVLKRLVRRTV